jgi:hypothetical protein
MMQAVQNRIQLSWTVLASIIILSIFGVLFGAQNAHAALATPPYTTAELNAKLYGGVQQAIDWDKACYDGLRAERAAGSPPRQAVNQAPSYQNKQWMSLADTATQNNSSRTAPIVVDYGTQSVPLQLNIVKFICAALVSPDGAGADFAYTNQRVVRLLTNANDRAPNPMGGNTNWPALTDTRYRIDNITVEQGNGHITGTAIGKYIGTARQANTRYWFANPVGFNFVSNSPNGLTEDTEVKVRFTLRGYNTYYYNTYQCIVNGNTYVYPPNPVNISLCDQKDVTLSISINIRNLYTLTPTASVGGQNTIEPGGTANVANTVAKSAGGTDSAATDWRLTQLDFAPNKTLSVAEIAARDGAGDPCAAFTNNGRTGCKESQRNAAAIFRNATTAFNPGYVYTADENIAAGTKVCFVASVSRPTQAAAPIWRHSAMVCMVVAKKPKVQVWGGDVKVRGKIDTSTSVSGTPQKKYGSWVEYGAFAVGTITGFGSGSAYNDGTTATTVAQVNQLTFANVDTAGNSGGYGNFTLSPISPTLIGQFTAAATNGPLQSDLGGLASGTYKGTNVTLNASTVGQDATGKGKSIVIVASGTVTIQGDINYGMPGGAFTDINQLPQVVIIANRINIANSVGQVNAWLLTTGDGFINTCSDRAVTAALNATVCNNKLTVNGPVATQHLYLRRTAGSNPNDSAEQFNLRPDAYIWAQRQASENSKAQTVYSTELPPRF